MPEFTKKICTGLRWLLDKLIDHDTSVLSHQNGFTVNEPNNSLFIHCRKDALNGTYDNSTASGMNLGDIIFKDVNNKNMNYIGTDLVDIDGKRYTRTYIGNTSHKDSTVFSHISIYSETNSVTNGTVDAIFQTNGIMKYCKCVTPTEAQHVANKQYVDNHSIPSGMISWFWLQQPPSGWVVCNGKWYSSDGKTSSNSKTDVCTRSTPNLIGRYPLGVDVNNVGGTVAAGLPNITGSITSRDTVNENSAEEPLTWSDEIDTAGALRIDNKTVLASGYVNNNKANTGYRTIAFDASKSNAIYGNSTTVTPPSVKLLPCMKL